MSDLTRAEWNRSDGLFRWMLYDDARAKAKRLEEALKFYADPKQYEVDGPLVGGAWGSPHYPIDDDRGEIARVALHDFSRPSTTPGSP
jgi:hypothetical protein